MKKDYDWIREAVDEAERRDEPLFLVRGQDFFALTTLIHYGDEFERFGPTDHEFAKQVWDLRDRFKRWQSDNRDLVKYPD